MKQVTLLGAAGLPPSTTPHEKVAGSPLLLANRYPNRKHATGNQVSTFFCHLGQSSSPPFPPIHPKVTMTVNTNKNASSRPASPATSDRRSLTANNQNASSASVERTPKMETPLWIKLRAELLMAPKKTVKMLRRHSTTPNFESGAPVPNATLNDANRRPRSHICKDLFGAKVEQRALRG